MRSIALHLASLFVALALPAGTAVAASIDPDYAPNLGGLGQVAGMATASDGTIFLGGAFDSIGPQTLNGLARIYPDGSVDSNFLPVLIPAGSSLLYIGITRLSDGRILINGNFRALGATASNYAVVLNPDGTVAQTFPYARNDNGAIRYYGLSSGKFMVCDDSGGFGFPPVFGLARLNADGSVDGTFFSLEQNIGQVLDLLDGTILVTGGNGSIIHKLSATGIQDGTFISAGYNG